MGYVRELRSLIGHRPLIIPGAALLIVDQQNRLLLQHRKDNQQWGLIGGSMEVGESLEETAKREALEETGLEVDKLEWFGLFSGQELIYQYPNGDIVVNVVAVYITRQFRGELKADDDEAHEIYFFNLRELPKNLSPPDRPVIEQYLRSLMVVTAQASTATSRASCPDYSGATRHMKNRTMMRERYLSEALPNRLGELAANLARIKSFSSNIRNCDAVKSLIEESKFFIEWTAMDVGIDGAAELVEIQVQLARWQLAWSSIWTNNIQRMKVAEQAKIWSERVLEMSGLLSESVTISSEN